MAAIKQSDSTALALLDVVAEEDSAAAWRKHASTALYLERTAEQVFHDKTTGALDLGGDRDTRPAKPCCDRVGTGAWCTLDKGHTGEHASASQGDYNPVRDPEYKFLPANPPKVVLRLRGGWRDELTLKTDKTGNE